MKLSQYSPSSTMKLNADLSQRAVVNSNHVEWVASPAAGVWRKPLERDGDEVARLTSIVRYDPGCSFPEHEHGGGEEFFVLEGTFEDENGAYPAGTFVKNPVGTKHSPKSTTGCTILVKLRHMRKEDQVPLVINTHKAQWRQGLVPGLTVMPLDSFETRHTALVRWAPETYFNRHQHWGGEEIFVLEGVFSDENGDYPAGTWIRSPHASAHTPFSKPGCLILVRTGHLSG